MTRIDEIRKRLEFLRDGNTTTPEVVLCNYITDIAFLLEEEERLEKKSSVAAKIQRGWVKNTARDCIDMLEEAAAHDQKRIAAIRKEFGIEEEEG